MSTHALDHQDRDVAEINIIPLADVLLVLLIIFMVTAPATTRAIPLDLPAPNEQVPPRPPQELMLRIDAVGDVYRQGQLVPLHALQTALEAESLASAPIALRLDADDDADYAVVAQVLASAQRAGLADIAFARGR
jgi:biopolymer transport protein ExbD